MVNDYNVRLVHENGELKLGFVHGLYRTTDNRRGLHQMEWKDAPDSIRNKIAKQFGIKTIDRRK